MRQNDATWRSVALGAALLVVCATSSAQEIEITGELRLETYLENAEGTLRVLGQVSDELGAPVVGQVIIFDGNVGQQPLPLLDCGKERGQSARTVPQLRTDDLGQFCANITTTHKQITVQASADHFPLVTSKPQPERLSLRHPLFTEVPLHLDKHVEQSLAVEILASTLSAGHRRRARLNLQIKCGDEESIVGTEEIVGSRLARFEIRASEWMPPGPCELEATLSTTGMRRVSSTHPLIVRDQVRLSEATHTVVGNHLEVSVEQDSPRWSAGGVIEGAVVGEAPFATLPLVQGETTTFSVPISQESRQISFQYRAEGPYWLAGPPLLVNLPATHPLSDWPWHASGLSVFLAWVVYKWFWATPFRKTRNRQPQVKPEPSVQFETTSTGPIRGTVADCHTGEPIARATLSLEPLGVRKTDGEALTSVSDEFGRFEFEAAFSERPLSQLTCCHEDYVSMKTTLKGSTVTLRLASTRRSALQRLHDWSAAAGSPWNVATKPTVGHIETLAQAEGRRDVARWTENVSQMAYGPTSPSESDIERLGTRPRPTPKRSSDLS